VRVTVGGPSLRSPSVVNDDVLGRLAALCPLAPLHLPSQIECIRACQRVFPAAPVVAAAESAFFADLPERERTCALSADIDGTVAGRRSGLHGLFHEAACRSVRRSSRAARRVLSVCLDAKSEVAAVMGMRPLMVTGGVTPAEGLPGESSCGDIDPSLPLTLIRKTGWGPEQVNDVLTRQSGLAGLVGRSVPLDRVLAEESPEHELAGRVFRYRLLQACGAGMAALGGVDAIVFSGRYGAMGDILGPELVERLQFPGGDPDPPVWRWYPHRLERIVADAALDMLAAARGAA